MSELKADLMGLAEWVEERVVPVSIKADGRELWSSTLLLPPAEPTPEPIALTTLQGISEYILSDPDGLGSGNLICLVNATSVKVVGQVWGRHKQRSVHAIAQYPLRRALENGLGSWQSPEQFIVWFRKSFEDVDDFGMVTQVVGDIKSTEEVEVRDDGIAQEVAVTKSIGGKQWSGIGDGFVLAPFRTFPEIEGPRGTYILRVSGGSDLTIGLFEVDDGDWEALAGHSIVVYLEAAFDAAEIENADRPVILR